MSTAADRSAMRTLDAVKALISWAARLAAFGEISDLGGDHREAFAMLAGASGFDGGVESQQIGLIGDLLDDRGLRGDRFHRHRRLADSLAGLRDFMRAIEGHEFHLSAIVGVLGDRRVHLLETGAGFLHRGGLFAGPL